MQTAPTAGHDPGEARLHRALGDPSRVRILEELRADPTPCDASELASRIGLHPNTVRSHLRVLAEAGLVSQEREERHRPGRPRLVFTAVRDSSRVDEPAGYRLLAEILAASFADAEEDSSERALQAGRAWGSYLVGRSSGQPLGDADEEIEAVVRILREFGFDPTLESAEQGHTLVMQHCPFGAVGESYREVVCSVHFGLIQGALDGLGAHARADDLRPLVRPGICTAHLERVAS